jgi:hypothetical protein
MRNDEMKNKLIVASLFTVVSPGVMAQESASKETGYYAELGVTQVYFKQNDTQFNHMMADVKVGYNFSKNIAVEVMLGNNLNSADTNYNGTNVNAKISSAYGGYGKFSLPVSDVFSLFVRLGVTDARLNSSSNLGSDWSSGFDFSYGGGAQFNFTKEVYGQIDYMSYYNKNNVSVAGPSISIGYKF